MKERVKDIKEESNVRQWHLSHVELKLRLMLMNLYWILPVIVTVRNNDKIMTYFYYEYGDDVIEQMRLQRFLNDWINNYRVRKWLPGCLFRLLAKISKRFSSDADIVDIYKKYFSE